MMQPFFDNRNRMKCGLFWKYRFKNINFEGKVYHEIIHEMQVRRQGYC